MVFVCCTKVGGLQMTCKILQMHGLPCTHTKSEPSKVMLKKPYIVTNQMQSWLAMI